MRFVTSFSLCDFDISRSKHFQRIDFETNSKIPFLKMNFSMSQFPPPPPQKKRRVPAKTLGEFVFGPLHTYNAVHCASRNYTWKAGILFVTDGVDH